PPRERPLQGKPAISPEPSARRRASPEPERPAPEPQPVARPDFKPPSIPPRSLFEDDDDLLDEFVGPEPEPEVSTEDHTDPIGFVAAPLPDDARDDAERSARRSAGHAGAEAPLRFGVPHVADDDITDPSGPLPAPSPR